MTIWQTVVLDVTGLILGAAAGAASVAVVSKQLAGTWMPYLTWPPVAVIGATVVGLTIIAILAPTLWPLAPRSNRNYTHASTRGPHGHDHTAHRGRYQD